MMNPRSTGPPIASAIALLISVTAQTQATAQPIFETVDSLETTIANADLVIIATIERFLDERNIPNNHKAATLLVEETLKASLDDDEGYQKLFAHLPGPPSTLSQWEKENRRLLVTVQEESLSAASVIDLADENLEVLTADLTILRDPEDVVRIARETIDRMPAAIKRIHTVRLNAPRELVAGTQWQKYDGVNVTVPVDDRLERRAIESIRSESYERRLEGARALRYFKSDENIDRLKPLLDDPGNILRPGEQDDSPEIRHYGIREAAYRTLKSWGVAAEPPVIREGNKPN